jgi:hypothetical protein
MSERIPENCPVDCMYKYAQTGNACSNAHVHHLLLPARCAQVAQALSTRVDLLSPAYFEQIQLLQVRLRLTYIAFTWLRSLP